jgi:hypothetical protein
MGNPVLVVVGAGYDVALGDLATGVASLLTAVRAVLPARDAATLGVQKAALRNLVQALDADLRPRGPLRDLGGISRSRRRGPATPRGQAFAALYASRTWAEIRPRSLTL